MGPHRRHAVSVAVFVTNTGALERLTRMNLYEEKTLRVVNCNAHVRRDQTRPGADRR